MTPARKKPETTARRKAKARAGGPKKSPVTAAEALAWLEARGARKNIDALKRYGITVTRAFGVTVGDTKKYGQQVGKDHALAQKLWESGWYEARLLAAFVDEPAQVTARQMQKWAADFDNWAIVDTVCFHLFDRAPDAWSQVPVWANETAEFTKRAAFALLWSLSLHDKTAPESLFLKCLPLFEEGARDDRNFVKKAVNMALRAVGRRSPALNAAAIQTAQRLAAMKDATPRWVGRHALRELTSAAARKRLHSR
jgi:3-methyladenine DNA glycosylase AlkD